ncbi:RidA family protein, partial [Pseudomonas sp.]
MSRTVFELSNPSGLYDPSGNAYSHVATLPAQARLVYVAGQGGEELDGTLASDFSAQARQALANVQTALQSQGASLTHVFKLTLLIVDHNEAKLRAWVAEADLAWGTAMK